MTTDSGDVMRARLIAISVAVVLSSGCGPAESGMDDVADPTAVQGRLLVSAAASLTDAFGELESAFEADHPGVDVLLNLGGSSALREQILEGAPADVFAPADRSSMDHLVDAARVTGEVTMFTRNRLQIAVPAGNPGNVTSLEDLRRDELVIGLCAEGVPCGDLAHQALGNAGVVPALDTNEPDVRALLTKIAAGELDAGITYVTDVAAAGTAVEGVDIPKDLNVVAEYPIAVLADAPNPPAAVAFVDFVLSDAGQQILASYGFASP